MILFTVLSGRLWADAAAVNLVFHRHCSCIVNSKAKRFKHDCLRIVPTRHCPVALTCSKSWRQWWIVDDIVYTSSTAQGGGGSFKNRKPIGEIGCCESGMAERIHSWTKRCLRSPLFLSLSLTIYLHTNQSSMYLSIYLSIDLSIYPSLSFI